MSSSNVEKKIILTDMPLEILAKIFSQLHLKKLFYYIKSCKNNRNYYINENSQ